jgi:hypothetical protein
MCLVYVYKTFGGQTGHKITSASSGFFRIPVYIECFQEDPDSVAELFWADASTSHQNTCVYLDLLIMQTCDFRYCKHEADSVGDIYTEMEITKNKNIVFFLEITNI